MRGFRYMIGRSEVSPSVVAREQTSGTQGRRDSEAERTLKRFREVFRSLIVLTIRFSEEGGIIREFRVSRHSGLLSFLPQVALLLLLPQRSQSLFLV